MKLYIILILNKIQNIKKTHFKALKMTKLVLFPRRIIVMSTKLSRKMTISEGT